MDLSERGGRSLPVGSTIPWAGVLGSIKRRKRAEHPLQLCFLPVDSEGHTASRCGLRGIHHLRRLPLDEGALSGSEPEGFRLLAAQNSAFPTPQKVLPPEALLQSSCPVVPRVWHRLLSGLPGLLDISGRSLRRPA